MRDHLETLLYLENIRFALNCPEIREVIVEQMRSTVGASKDDREEWNLCNETLAA